MKFGKAGLALTATELHDLLREDLEQVDREIGLRSVASVDAITTIGHYLHQSGGKRLRPTLLLLSSKLAGGGGPSAIRMAAVVEMIHTATLVHDDVIDVAQIRRGRPSPNVLWGNHTSVLAGDWLYMQAFQVALEERDFRILDLLIGLTQTMVEGELLQLQRIGLMTVTESDYMDLVDRKTASLFSACARLGAIMAGAAEETEGRLGEYAWNLGMAFQLVDDVLDFTARQDVLGKAVGSDLGEGKVTLPVLYTLEQAEPSERQQVETVLRDGNYGRVSFESVLAIIKKHKGIERAMRRAEDFTQKARTIMGAFPTSPFQRALYGLTDLVTARDH
ncbi:MAG: polyprenyl synthetase family protein [Bryobacteraceae bacterium]